jgi:3'(2'), 5'-bisphosphate nucleotidase
MPKMTILPISSNIQYLNDVIDTIILAGEKVREIYESDFQVDTKDDNSPITKADLESNKIIKSYLEKTGLPVLSEEDTDDKSRLNSKNVWIIDPLDGTTDFVNRTGEFTIMIGLVEDHVPVMGLVYWPTKKRLYFAEKGFGAFSYESGKWSKITVRENNDLKNCVALVSRHHLSDKEKKILERLTITQTTSIGSSLKVMEISSGTADVYLTTTNKMKQWDTCASHCIISEAGGKMTDVAGNDIVYNTDVVNHQNGLLVTNGFVHQIALSKISEMG